MRRRRASARPPLRSSSRAQDGARSDVGRHRPARGRRRHTRPHSDWRTLRCVNRCSSKDSFAALRDESVCRWRALPSRRGQSRAGIRSSSASSCSHWSRPSIPSHDDRELVDLIWFPTGGGKTEAYLGLAAIEMIRRRLDRGVSGGGTAVITRYTMRLLTAQQFQRAATLICALELMRKR